MSLPVAEIYEGQGRSAGVSRWPRLLPSRTAASPRTDLVAVLSVTLPKAKHGSSWLGGPPPWAVSVLRRN